MIDLDGFIQEQYGIRVDTKIKTVSVGTSPVQLVDNNPNRLSYTISNQSGQTIFTDHYPSVATTTGAFVGVGSAQGFDWRVDAQTVGYDLYAVVASQTSIVYVREVVIIPPITKRE